MPGYKPYCDPFTTSKTAREAVDITSGRTVRLALGGASGRSPLTGLEPFTVGVCVCRSISVPDKWAPTLSKETVQLALSLDVEAVHFTKKKKLDQHTEMPGVV
jgi:hypothetical protein